MAGEDKGRHAVGRLRREGTGPSGKPGGSRVKKPIKQTPLVLPVGLKDSKPGQGVDRQESSNNPNHLTTAYGKSDGSKPARPKTDRPKTTGTNEQVYAGQTREQLDGIIDEAGGDPVKAMEMHRKRAEEIHGQAITNGTSGWDRFESDQEYVKATIGKGKKAANDGSDSLEGDDHVAVGAGLALGVAARDKVIRQAKEKGVGNNHRRRRSVLPWMRAAAHPKNWHRRTRRRLPRLGIVPVAVGVAVGIAALARYGGNAPWGQAIKNGLSGMGHYFVPQAARNHFSESANLLRGGKLLESGKALASGLYEVPLIGGVIDLVRDPVGTVKQEIAGLKAGAEFAQDAYALAQKKPNIARQGFDFAGSVAAQDGGAILHRQQQLAASVVRDTEAREFAMKHYDTLDSFGAIPKSSVHGQPSGPELAQGSSYSYNDEPDGP